MTVGTPPSTEERVLRYLSVGKGFQLFAQEDGKTTLGDHFVFHDDLQDADGTVVGRDAGVCTLASDRSYQLNVTMELPGGCVTAQGFVENELGLLAVTGGTEIYRQVRGDVRIGKSGEEGLDVTLRITGVLAP
ncbi:MULTISPECIES: hypothetical protein [Streptomyces]|uniref:DUF3224 domain-containing protein n=1 Tax=Streptomyces californicus TaxID=67351 RepID=A0ABD7CT35_9ACTN|nr:MULTISPECIES: hypothetical protein [Streptomyces]MYW81625.1 hypothetical protein [Streptomyces sp. SID8369]NEA12972.1 hypothetical protein [Streptomyces sp. SID10692]NEC45600.1 hypothetical protein [Streptomyces sp. SID8016]KOU51276.1 hypothetical protein ADK56_10835 [Streptomyces sp. MMG1522]MBD3549569.1 hypothetical protein [Streptomyces sp. JV180]